MKNRKGLADRRRQVVDLYRSGLSMEAIGRQFGVNRGTICHDLRLMGEPSRGRSEARTVRRRVHDRAGTESGVLRLTLPTHQWNRLEAMASSCGRTPGQTASRLVAAVLEDDEAAEEEETIDERA